MVIVPFVLCLAGALLGAQAPRTPASEPFSVVEASLTDMRAALAQGRTSSHDIVQQYLTRIAAYEDLVNATISINPHALDEADALDRERRQGQVRGPLHGIPVALKDNIQTTHMPTTGGALVFAGLVPPYEATLTKRLRDGGAIIIAKTVMTELANWVAAAMPGGYSTVGGYSFNPYAVPRDPLERRGAGRPVLSPGGSSSGTGTAANLWAANVGTETSGSILNPASLTMLAAIKPTVGRISRHGVIPITADQDTAGPMARSVADAAILLGALEGTAPDPNDPATRRCPPPPNGDYTRFLQPDALKGARIGIPRAYFYSSIELPGTAASEGGLSSAHELVMGEAIAALRAQGAVIVDPADIPSITTPEAAKNLLSWPECSGSYDVRGRDEACSIVFKYGMKRDFTTWLASLGAAAPVKSLAELRAWNRAHTGAIAYGQAQLDISDQMDVARDRARYETDHARDVTLGGAEGIDAALRAHQLDALLFPGSSGANLAARPGYPTVIVPFGAMSNTTSNTTPNVSPPLGVSFTGTACSEPRLIALAYAFEQATKRRVPPKLD